MSCIRAGIFLFALLFIGVQMEGQFSVSIEAPSQVDWCDEIIYDLRVENLDEINPLDRQITIEFNHRILLSNTTLDSEYVNEDGTTLTVNLQELDACSFLKASIAIVPDCTPNILVQLIAIPQSSTIGALPTMITNLPTIAMSLVFDDYDYDGVEGILRKSVTISNIGSSVIESFNLDLTYANEFAMLSETNVGILGADNQIIIRENDLPQGGLRTQESITMELTHDLIGCRIGPVQYNIESICELSTCTISNLFIDDNEVDLFLPIIETPETLNYGLCNYTYNEVVIKQDKFSTDSPLSNVLDISTVLRLQNSIYPFGSCLDFDFRINGEQVDFEEQDETTITVRFSSLDTDPDGPGGLEDLDGDGNYNDLANGDSIILQIGILAEEDCSTLDSNVPFTISGAGGDLCGEILDANPQFIQVLPLPRISTSSWSFLPEDNNGISYIELGDSIDWILKINQFANQDPECDTPEWFTDISIPESLQWIEEMGITYEGPTDTFLVQGNLVDTSLSFSNIGLLEGQFRITFEAQCPDNPYVNLNPNVDIKEQCLEWKKFNLVAYRTWNCKNDNSCNRTIVSTPSFSTGHRILCAEEEELVSIVSLDSVEFRRVNGGWMDAARTEKWDPDLHGHFSNNHYFYDHDTMRFRIPFQVDSISLLNSFTLFVDKKIRGQAFTMSLVSSTLNNYGLADTIQSSRNVRPLTDVIDRSTSLNVRKNEYALLNIQEGDSMMWEIAFIIDVERARNQETISFVGEELRVYVEENKNGCTSRGPVQEFVFQISEVFIERLQSFGGGFSQLFTIGTNQSGTMQVKPSAAGGLDSLAYEYRPGVEYTSILITVPQGYELMDRQLEIPGSLQFDTTGGFLTIIQDTIVATEVTMTEEAIIYEFQFDTNFFQNRSITEGINFGANIQLLCPPRSTLTNITIQSVGTYVDYYEGSLATVPISLNDTLTVEYLPFDFAAVDEFVVADQGSNSYWEIIDRNSIGGFADPFSDRNGFEGKVVEYSSDQIRIDSISECQFLFIDPDSTLLVSYIYDTITENRFHLRQPMVSGGDGLFDFAVSKSLILHFSNQKCGFDTVFLQLGTPSIWEEGCLDGADMDTLVVYTPVGIPEVKWIQEPERLNYCESNTLTWTLRNIAEGGLLSPSLQIDIPQLDNPTLLITTTTTSHTANELLRPNNSGYEIFLSDIGIDTLSGTRDMVQEIIQFDLSWEPDCELPTSFNTTIRGEGISLCGDSLTSPSLLLQVPAFSIEEDTSFQMSIATFSNVECGEEIKYRVEIFGDMSETLMDDSLVIFLPKGQIFLNTILTDTREHLSIPSMSTHGDFQILSWRDIVVLDNAGRFSFEIIMLNTCLDVCSDNGEARAALLSRLDVACTQETCSRYVLRADTGWDNYDWRSDMILSTGKPEIIARNNDSLIMEISWELEQQRKHLYEGLVKATYFNDINGNGLLDGEDVIFEVTSHRFSNYFFLEGIDTISTQGISLCELGLLIELEESCDCFPLDPIILNQEQIGSRTEILICSDETYEFQIENSNSDCDVNWSNHPNVDLSDPDRVIYNSLGITIYPDTVIQNTICNNCTFKDTFIFQIESVNLDIEEISPLCGEEPALLRASIDGLFTQPSTYYWSNDTSNRTPEIEINQPGIIEVEVILPSGCVLSESYELMRQMPEYDLLVTYDPCIPGQPAQVELNSDHLLTVIWSDSVAQLSRQDLEPGTYTLTISDSSLCSVTDTVAIAPFTDLSEVLYPSSLSAELGESISIQPISTGDQEYSVTWLPAAFFSCDTCIETTLLTALDTVVQLTLMDEQGCSLTQDITIEIESSFDGVLPNIFSPNSASPNSIFFPSTDQSVFLIKNFQIIDRWGNIMFLRENLAPDDISLGWNGKQGDLLASSGIYVYLLELELIDGTNEKLTGTVALVR